MAAYGFFIVGALEAFAVGWVWGWSELRERCGKLCAFAFELASCVRDAACLRSISYLMQRP